MQKQEVNNQVKVSKKLCGSFKRQRCQGKDPKLACELPPGHQTAMMWRLILNLKLMSVVTMSALCEHGFGIMLRGVVF
jgi:hypothetical protein